MKGKIEFMDMNHKKGISLIVLVIIIVIIILALAVILSINKNNPIENARKAYPNSDKNIDSKYAVSTLIYGV